LFKEESKKVEAFKLLSQWMEKHPNEHELMRSEYVKLLIDVGNEKVALAETKKLLEQLNNSLTRHYCSHCGFNSDEIFWRCPQCHNWETIQFRWKI